MDAHVLLSPVGQKTETRFNCLLTENRKSTEVVGTPFPACRLLPPSADGSPPSKREVYGLRRSRPPALPSIAYRGFAVAPNPLGLAERVPRPADGGRRTRFPKLKFMRQNAEPCAGLRRILLNFIFNSARSVNSLPFSGGDIRPERKKFNKPNSPPPPPLTPLKFPDIPAFFF